MPSVAAWLVARPLNAVLALAATLSLPLFGFLSGAVLAFLVLAQGPRQAAVEAAIAGALMLALATVIGLPLEPKLAAMVMVWLPAMLVSVLLASSRSLTLTLQVTAIVAVLGVIAFFMIAGNPAALWTRVLTEMVAEWSQSDVPQLVRQAEAIRPQIDQLAQHVTVWLAFFAWGTSTLMLLLGQALYRHAPRQEQDFGRFRDLNFGRVIAIAMAVASLVAFLSGLAWLQSVAFVIFAVFSFQGVALVHWLHAENRLPVFMVVAMYASIVVLPPIVVAALAVLGYIDAWFSLRRRRVLPS